jgi:hypothetical protein
MKKIFLFVFLFFVTVSLSAQSDTMRAMAKAHANEITEAGYRILFQQYGDLNENRYITSGMISFQSGKKYAVVLLVEGRANANIVLHTANGYVEPKTHWDFVQNVTRIITSFDRFSTAAEVRGTITGLHWHTGYLIIGVK